MVTAEMARKETVCRGCGKPKNKETIVCWNCFKCRRDIVPFKYFEGGIEEWLKQIKK